MTGHDHDALECADRVRKVFEEVLGTSYELARLSMVKAPALQRVARAEEAVKLLRQAAATFRAHGELLWYVDANDDAKEPVGA